ncbi:AMP-binding protein [Niveispirillum sp. KHB5.9]
MPIALLRGGLPAPESMVETGPLLLLETSGTTGTPKRIARSFASVLSGIEAPRGGDGGRWLLTYDACGFAGLQVLLTALAGGGVLLADPDMDAAGLARLAVDGHATHISATPSFWRMLLLSNATPSLTRITLGGEAVDQALLDALASRFPGVPIRCIYASTELGRLFTVPDGREGFPAAWLSQPPGRYSFRIWNDMLQVRFADDWQDTGDLVEIVGNRVLFRGRNDFVVNVGGAKVNPALAENRLLSLRGITDALVYGIPNPITGAILAADIVAPDWQGDDGWRTRVNQALADLPTAARPRRLRLVETLPLSAAGKKRRIAEEA